MAPPWPEEVDVFTVPHSRMKKLVNKYSKMIQATDFTDELHFQTLLQNLYNVFMEFKAHETIENTLIMKKLKYKLKAASVTSSAVCNCHNDNRLTDMLDLVYDGYKWTQKTNEERQIFGQRLQEALERFTEKFIPHMEEEEEIFQPMLMEYFPYEELKKLKARVIYEHSLSKAKKNLDLYVTEKFVEDLSEESEEEAPEPECFADSLPNEIFLKIFSYLNPQDLAWAGQVSQRWHQMTRDPSLWSRLHPVHWAQGNWTFYPELMGGVDSIGAPDLTGGDDEEEEGIALCVDEDADIDESGDSDTTANPGSDRLKKILQEVKMMTGLVKYLLPHVGAGVKMCDLAYSKGISSSLVHKILKLCPNLEFLDLTHTPVGDAAFKEYGVSGRQSKLRHLDLTGCSYITDLTLFSLADASEMITYGSEDGDDDKEEMELEIETLPPSCAQKLSLCCGKKASLEAEQTFLSRCSSGMSYISLSESSSDPDVPPPLLNNCCDMQLDRVRNSSGTLSNDSEACDSRLCVMEPFFPDGSKPVECCTPDGGCNLPLKTYEGAGHTSAEIMCMENVTDLLAATADSLPVNQKFQNHNSDFLETGMPYSDSGHSCTFTQSCCISGRQQTKADSTISNMQNFSSSCCNNMAAVKNRCRYVRTNDSICDNGEFSDDLSAAGCCGVSRFLPSVCCGNNTMSDLNSEDNASNNHEEVTQEAEMFTSKLEYLSLNGCFRITDEGLWALAQGRGTPELLHLDLSGCVGVTGAGVAPLVASCHRLDMANVYYCNNMLDDPFHTSASGCLNLQCGTRFCCSYKE